jgi:hypothetical protein
MLRPVLTTYRLPLPLGQPHRAGRTTGKWAPNTSGCRHRGAWSARLALGGRKRTARPAWKASILPYPPAALNPSIMTPIQLLPFHTHWVRLDTPYLRREGQQLNENRRSRQRIFVATSIIVGIIGLAFVFSAPFDGTARTALGSGLITGLIVGLAVAAIQWTVESRRVDNDQKTKEQQCAAIQEIARSRLGLLISHYIWIFWYALLPYVGQPAPLVGEIPQGYRAEDVQNTQRTLQWLREKTGADERWWQDATLLAVADAICFVAIDLLGRLEYPDTLGEERPAEIDSLIQELQEVRDRAVRRLPYLADLLAGAGDIDRALTVNMQVDALESRGKMPTYIPDEFRMSYEACQVGWLTDQLRRDPVVKVNEYGVPLSPCAQDASDYRWCQLFTVNEDRSIAWNQRFASGSWLRSIFDRARRELPGLYGLETPDTN